MNCQRWVVYSAPSALNPRISLYGSNDVVALLAEFERFGGMIGNEKQREAFVRLVNAMRCNPNTNDSELHTILFGERPDK